MRKHEKKQNLYYDFYSVHFVERQFEIKREREWWRWREREENQPMKRTEKIYRQTHFATNEGEDRESFTYSFFSSSNKYHGWETLFYMLIVLLITLTKTSLCMAARTIWKDNQFSFFFLNICQNILIWTCRLNKK